MAFAILGTPKPQFFDSSGSPLTSGTLAVLDPADDTNKASYPTYDDAEAATNANDNPLTLDSRGEPSGGLWGLDGEDYKLVLKDSDGVTVWTTDDIFQSGGLYAVTSAETAAAVTIVNYTKEPGNVLRYGTNTTPGTTDMSTAAQAALDVLEQMGGGTWVIPAEGIAAQGLILKGDNIHIECRGWINPVSNASADSVLQIGVDSTDLVRELTGNLNLGGLSQLASNWTNITGLDCKYMNECQLHVSSRGFAIGIAGSCGAGGFVAYNNFFIGALVNNKIDISLDPQGSGAVNENKFYGGRFGENSGTWASGRICIHIDDDGSHQVNHNVFYSPSFESDGRIADWVGGLDNFIVDARYEPPLSGTPDTDYDSVQLSLDSTCQRNTIHLSGGDSWFTNGVDHGAGTRVNDSSFTIAGTDVTSWFYPGAPMLLTIGGTVYFTYCRSSSFSTNTTVNVFLPVVSGDPTAIQTARFKNDGDDNRINGNNLGITSVDTFLYHSSPRSIINLDRSMLNISAISDTYPAVNIVAGGSGNNICWQVADLTGNVVGYMNGDGYEYTTRFSMGDSTTPQATFAAIADASGGSTVDAEARSALNTLLGRMRSFGFIST